jgi:MoaA/NifB/PqqE/SkfB family radical SAM enzyme
MISQKIDEITSIPEKYRNTICPAPPSVKIELTSRCNFFCGFCAHRLSQKTFGEMDFEFFKKITQEMRSAGVSELGLFYIGESMMCSWIEQAVRFAKEIGFPYVFLTTNGSLASPEKVAGLMEAGLDSLKFSLNSADQWQFRQITGMAPSVFALIKENVKGAWRVRKEGRYNTRLYASSIKYDGAQHIAMQQLVDELRPYIDEHYWLPLLSFGSQATQNEKAMGLAPVVGNPGRLDTMRAPLPCWAVFREGHITHDGLLSACCFDSGNQWIMADLNKTSFMDGWNSEQFQKLRAAHLAGDVHGTACEDCIHGVDK